MKIEDLSKVDFKPFELKIKIESKEELVTLATNLNASTSSIAGFCYLKDTSDMINGNLIIPLWEELNQKCIELGYKKK